MLSKTVKAVKFDSVMVESLEGSAVPSLQFTVNWSLSNTVNSDDLNYKSLENLRIRFFTAFDATSAKTLDFLGQRFNEYLLADSRGKLSIEDNSAEYTAYLREELSNKQSQYFSLSTPFSPYNVESDTTARAFANGGVKIGHGKTFPNNLAIYDKNLMECFLKTSSGAIVKQKDNGEARIPLVQPRLPKTEEQLLNEIGTNASESLNGTIVNQILAANPSITERLLLAPLQFSIEGVDLKSLSQISVYAYVYDPSTQKSVKTAWDVITTPVTSANLKGFQYLWAKATSGDLYVPQIPEDPSGAPNTNAGIFHNLETGIMSVIAESLNASWYSFFEEPNGVIASQNHDLKGFIKDKFSYSDLWLSQGADNKLRFAFALDEADILRRKSVLPSFYVKPEMIRQLLSGKKEDTGLSKDIRPSKVMDIQVIRHLIDNLPLVSSNDVNTSAHMSPMGPDINFPSKYICNASEVKNIAGFTDQKTVKFYEGHDDFSDEPILNLVNYSINVSAYDAAPMYLRAIVNQMMDHQNTITRIYKRLKNAASSEMNGSSVVLRSLSSFEDNFSQGRQNYLNTIAYVLRDYTRLLNMTLNVDPIDIEPYLKTLIARENNMPLSWVQEIESIISMGLNFYYNKLKSIFPDDPLGTNFNNNLFSLEKVGRLRKIYPIVFDLHTFNQSFKTSVMVDYGQDYVFSEQPTPEKTGLASIAGPSLYQRFTSEFQKYFQSSPRNNIEIVRDGQILNTDTLPELSPYLSPRVIMLPSQKSIDQLSFLGDRQAPYIKYNLDQYAHLFAEIIRIKNSMSKFSYGASVVSQNTASPQSDCEDETSLESEDLYSSVVTELASQYGVSFNETITPEYIPPKVSSGLYETTSGLTSALTYLPGPDMITSIAGGSLDDSNTETYVDSVEATLVNPSENQQNLDKTLGEAKEFKRPLKLPFAIFGELSLDPSINLDVTYQQKEFNSLKNLANSLGVNNLNVKEMLEGSLSNLPIQMKSMLIVATSTEAGIFYDQDPNGPYEASRPMLEDKNSSKNKDEIVSFWEQGSNQPDFSSTLDPMKIYAKFLAFWLNYKQLGVLECLSNFAGNESPEKPNVARDNWVTFSQDIVDSIPPGEKVLCRVRPFDRETYRGVLPASDGCEMYLATSYGEPQRALEIPIYNKYFYVESSNGPEPVDVNTEESSSEQQIQAPVIYSANQTNYY